MRKNSINILNINETPFLVGIFKNTSRIIAKKLIRVGVSANLITLFGLLMGILSAVSIVLNHRYWAATLLFFAGVADVLDGAVATEGKTASKLGSFLDGVCDRFVDAAVFLALCWVFAISRDLILFGMALFTFAFSSVISYIKPRALADGAQPRNIGPGGKSERFILIFVGLLWSESMKTMFVILVVLSALTVVLRIIHFSRELADT